MAPAAMLGGMILERYLERVGHDGPVSPDEATLQALHEAHLRTFPYENLDIQLGQPKVMAEARMAERMLDERRGGWCYEMNGVLSAALREIGFRVDRLGGAVARDVLGDDGIGNHMVLLVHLDRPMVADVGVGDGPLHAFPLEERTWSENGFEFALSRTDDGWWRCRNHRHGLAPSFDFDETPRQLEWYQPICESLQDGEGALFQALAMTFRRDAERIRALRELTYLEIEGPLKNERTIESFDDYASVLHSLIEFDLGDDLRRLYDKVCARTARRHAAAEAAAASSD